MKKFLAIILSVLMMMSVMPMAFAAEEPHKHAVGVDCSTTENAQPFIPLTQDSLSKASYNLFIGNYYLTEDITVPYTLAIRGFVNLCLNGYKITHTKEQLPAIDVQLGKLSVCDCKGTGEICALESSSRGIGVRTGAELNFYGGSIKAADSGISVNEKAVANVYGGKIYAGVGVSAQGTANLYGGIIGTDNEATSVLDNGVINNTGATICDDMCHQSGFMGFIWMIVSFLYQLFGINPVCACGKAHY